VKEGLEEKAKEFEDQAQEQQKVVKSLLEQSAQAKPEDKAKLDQEARDAAKVLEEYLDRPRPQPAPAEPPSTPAAKAPMGRVRLGKVFAFGDSQEYKLNFDNVVLKLQ